MEPMKAGDQTFLFDRQRTVAAYASFEHGGAEECGCSYCRNFAAQRDTIYPSEFRQLLASIGIDYRKEGEVYECGGDESSRQYGGWFYFTGQVTEPGERLTEAEGGFKYYFADAKRLPKPPADFGNDVGAVEFGTQVPWILATERP